MKKLTIILTSCLIVVSMLALPIETRAKTISQFEAEAEKLTKELEEQKSKLVTNEKEIKEIKATIPILSNKQEICFYNARHPLLTLDKVIGNNFILNEEHPLMLISGPNAGGKTVALKTVATLTYMVKLGIAIPVDENSKVGYFNRIFIDIGDNQSIENNLSTFSAQVNDLAVILKLISSRDLVVLDEICNGTDPKEGDSLAIAIVRYLLSKKCIALVTSHYPLLKKYGLSNQKVVNASFIFDQEKLEPTFKMTFGISGKSFGFSIANKFGIEETIVNDAKKIYEENYLSDEDRKIEVLEEKERGALILIASHNKEDITLLADQVFYINNGSLINQGGTLI